MTGIELSTIVLLFAVCSIGAYMLLSTFDPYWLRVQARLRHLEKRSDPSTNVSFLQSLFARFDRILPRQQTSTTQLEGRLSQAGLYAPASKSRFVAAQFLCGVIAAGLASTICLVFSTHGALEIIYVTVAAGLGFLAPSAWLNRRTRQRHVLLSKSLPDFLDLMIVCLEGGLSLQDTFGRVWYELQLVHPVLAGELAIVQRDIELGSTMDQALNRFAARTDYDGIRSLATFVREAQRFGTNIVEALRSHADGLRTQREQNAEENAQKAAVKILIPTLVFIFPAIFVVLVGPAIIQIQRAFADK